MKKTRFFALILCAVMLLARLPMTAQAADTVTEVSTVAQLKAALKNNTGAHVRLTADITFKKGDAEPSDTCYGIFLGDGYYSIDLNGHKIEYNYMASHGNNDGSPLVMQNTRGLTINGPGSIVGGVHGIEHGSDGILTINGGTLNGVMNAGIRATKGITVINGGEIKGNFNGIRHEDGIIIQNGGNVKSISTPRDYTTLKNYGLIDKNGAFTGEACLENVVLVMDDLTITPLSGITVTGRGGLIVTGDFVNNGEFTYESGLKSLDGDALLTAGTHMGYVYIAQDVTFKTLNIEEKAEIYITNGATATVTGAFVNDKGGVIADNGSLTLLSSIDHRGHSEGVPQLAELEGGQGSGGPDDGTEERDFIPETEAAERLKALRLFQGVGTNADGSTNFDLERAPSRTEALVMLIRLLGKESEAMSGSWTHPFTDVPTWADKYVCYAYQNKLTNGVSATEFGTGTASGQMYLTFVLRALGYSDAGGADFTWDKPEELAQVVTILPSSVHMDDFLRADVVTISEAALSARIKDSRDTLLDKLIAEGAVVVP